MAYLSSFRLLDMELTARAVEELRPRRFTSPTSEMAQ